MLESRRDELTAPAEREKLDRAIKLLRELSQQEEKTTKPTEARRVPVNSDAADTAPSLLAVDVADFIDHTDRYRGKVVTLPLMLRSRELIPVGQNLRALSGGAARFQGSAEDGNRLDLMIDLPRSLEIPKLTFGDRAVVSFRCTEGSLMRGNEAVEIRRPVRD